MVSGHFQNGSPDTNAAAVLGRQLSEEAPKNLALNEMKNLDLSHSLEMTKNHFNSNTNVISSVLFLVISSGARNPCFE